MDLRDRTRIDPRDVEDVVLGTVSQAGEQAGCIARMSVLAAGWPNEATGVSLNRFCGSGQQAVNFAAMGVASGMQDLVVAGGVESMSRNPMGSDKAGIDGHNRHLRELHPLVPQGISADLIAAREGFSRTDCDSWALRSQQNAMRAPDEGRFAKSLLPVRDYDGNLVLDTDEFPRPDTTLEGLGQLESSFAKIFPTLNQVPVPETDDGLVPINRMIDVEIFFKSVETMVEKLKKGGSLNKYRSLIEGIRETHEAVKKSESGSTTMFWKLIGKTLVMQNFDALRDFHWNALFIGTMHFMDRYNYDLSRVQRCCIHYATPDGRLIPFCTYNSGPVYREAVWSNHRQK